MAQKRQNKKTILRGCTAARMAAQPKNLLIGPKNELKDSLDYQN